ncbi:hypothetical protein JAAARDRAFT_141527 [Jaapia argillacea MUCL 33604]|uniref:Smr domain-containing protein n=1 Tax=Jaapia argillacea MUCL 33604 TaxID=933084 RepID=A0A067PI61_9AGAM|nr:hypothetical protein JAAARDRAFT_141527 [Jaapia argillacea MUCL 33604]
MVAEVERESNEQRRPIPAAAIFDLRRTLGELASAAGAQADEDEILRLVMRESANSFISTDDDSSGQDLSSPGTRTTSVTSTSDASSPSAISFSSPLGFLRTAFPHMSTTKLRKAISEIGDGDDIDMESVVLDLLNGEYLRELEERGLGVKDEMVQDLPWEMVKSKRNVGGLGSPVKKKGAQARKIAITDVRQQQHVLPRRNSSSSNGASGFTADQWTLISSLSSHLSTLLPSHPPSFFQSRFHWQEYSSPSKAVRAALVSIASTNNSSDLHPTQDDFSELTEEQTRVLFNMLEVISSSPDYETYDIEQRDRIMADVQIALRATQVGEYEHALDIVDLLRDLDSDRYLEMGIYHSAVVAVPNSTSQNTSGTSTLRRASTLPLGPPPVPPPPNLKIKAKPTPVHTNGWHSIPIKKPRNVVHPLSASIPSYNSNGSSSSKIKGSGNGIGKGGKGDVGELSSGSGVRGGKEGWRRKRSEALREASRYWQKGNARTRGGEIALFFAERARECQEKAREEALEDARDVVESRRRKGGDSKTVDLHGTTVAEAVVIVREILLVEGASAANPLKIITGKGTHSHNGVGVLGPAVKAALQDDGWSVGTWDGGLVVRGKVKGW